MSNKPTSKALTTREKISLSKTKYKISDLVEQSTEYIESILNQDPKAKKLPSVVGLCLHIGISRSRLYELRDKHKQVADIIEYIGMMQEEAALQGGITNRLNPVFSMFLLKGKHGYQDQAPQLNQTNNFNISPDLLADAIEIMRENNKS